MIIEEKDFKLTAINDYSPRFDLELLISVKSKNKDSRAEFKIVAYGITLDCAIKKIAHYRVSHKYDTTDLMTYFKEFRTELDSLKTLCGL